MTVRCKFRCDSKTEFMSGGRPLFNYKFLVVTSGSKENESFWQWTPGGNLNVDCVKDGTFQVGKEYYLDLSPATE